MKSHTTFFLVFTALLLTFLVGCAPITPTPESAPVAPPVSDAPVTASIQLPDGEQCLFAGTGAGIGADGKRLNYTCSDPNAPMTVILGNPQPASSGGWIATEGVVVHDDSGFTLQSSQEVSATIDVVALPDGTWCSNAGQGATLAFDGKRLNYTCPDSGENQTGLIGDFQIGDDGTWTAEEATISHSDSGFALESSEMVTVTVQQITLADGMQCSFSGEGATLAFDGQRVNFTCSEPNAPIVGLLGDITQIEETVWSVEKGTLAPGDNGFTLEASEIITYRIETLNLLDGTQCANAGQGATLAFDNKRLNYTCGESEGATLGILGDVQQGDAGLWTAEEATIVRGNNGFELESSTIVTVTAIAGGDLGGDAAASTATPALIGGNPNPASQYCTDQGGTLTLETRGDGGEFGVCYFEDNYQCEEWAMMRGQCPVGGIRVTGYLTPAARYCAITGGEYADNGTTSEADEQGTCTFPNGAVCPAADYYNGQCTP